MSKRRRLVTDEAYGPEHPEPLGARGNVAYSMGETGDVVGARDRFAALLPIRERVLGPDHPDTLTARADLARWTGRRKMALRQAGEDPGSPTSQILPRCRVQRAPERPGTRPSPAASRAWVLSRRARALPG